MALKNQDGNTKKHDANFQVPISDLKSAQKNVLESLYIQSR